MSQTTPSSTLSSVSGEAVSKIQAFLRKGDMVQAMKIYMQEARVGLKEAKDAIDREKAYLGSGGRG